MKKFLKRCPRWRKSDIEAARALILPDRRLRVPDAAFLRPHRAYLAHHRAHFKG